MNSMIEDSIFSLSHGKARDHLLKGKSYSKIDLPSYFTFDALLNDVRNILEQTCEEELYKKFLNTFRNTKLGDKEGINYSLFQSKDSRYTWRRFQLVNPVLYVALVLHITKKDTWGIIRNRFKKFAEGCVECTGLPSNPSSKPSPFLWWRRMEQKSIELSLQFEHILTTDLANCYDSIYTHSIAWALHKKKVAKENRDHKDYQYIGNVIDWHLRTMNDEQTNGIPTGSVLMDLVAEMVLGYMDLELTEKLSCKKAISDDYRILRYRDDYRIFVNDLTTGTEIMKSLVEIAMPLGFQLNSSKTKRSDNVVRASIKDDKIAWIIRKQEQEEKKKPKEEERRSSQLETVLLENILIIHDHSCQFPNAGSLLGALKQYHRKLKEGKDDVRSDAAMVLASVVTDIACRNPRWQGPCAALLGEFLALPSLEKDEERRLVLWENIQLKFRRFFNTAHMETWLQRFTAPRQSHTEQEYEARICQLVDHLENEKPGLPPTLWDMDWVKEVDEKLGSLEYNSSIIDLKRLRKERGTISLAEAYPSSDEYDYMP